MKVDCTQCEMYRSEHCDDCLVTALLRPLGDEVEIDEGIDPSLRALSGAGLIPVLKFRPRRDGPRLATPAGERAKPPDERSEAG